MGLITLTRPDRLAVANALRLPAARATLKGTAITLGCLALGGVVVGGRFLVAEPMLAALAEAPGVVAPLILAASLVVPLAVTAGLGLTEARRALFGSRAAELLLVAPVGRGALVLRAWLVGSVRLLAVQLALAWPLLAAVLLLPVSATCVLAAVVLRRWASGPRLRLAVNLVGGLAGLALALLAGAGLVTQLPGQEALGESLAAADGKLPWLLAAGGRLLAWCAGLLPLVPGDLALLALPLVAAPLLALAAAWIGPAWEAGLVAGGGRGRGRGAAGPGATRWPTGLIASVARKDLLAQLKAKGNLGALGFLLAVAVLAVGSSGPAEHLGDDPPAHVALVLGLFNPWLMLVMLLACLQGGTLLDDEAAHADLLALAPVDRGRLLLAKLPGFVAPHLLVLVATLGAAVSLHDAGGAALGLLLAVTLPILAGTLGLLLAVGTLPALNLPAGDDATQMRRVLLVGAVVVGLCLGLMTLGFEVRSDVFHHLNTPGRQLDVTPWLAWRGGGLWLAGGGLFIAGVAAARRNLERLLTARD